MFKLSCVSMSQISALSKAIVGVATFFFFDALTWIKSFSVLPPAMLRLKLEAPRLLRPAADVYSFITEKLRMFNVRVSLIGEMGKFLEFDAGRTF